MREKRGYPAIWTMKGRALRVGMAWQGMAEHGRTWPASLVLVLMLGWLAGATAVVLVLKLSRAAARG
jgi:hypothetical protein